MSVIIPKAAASLTSARLFFPLQNSLAQPRNCGLARASKNWRPAATRREREISDLIAAKKPQQLCHGCKNIYAMLILGL